MEHIFAIISDGKVLNVVVATPENAEKMNAQIVDVTDRADRPSPGWLYDGENFVIPDPVEGEIISSNKQLKFSGIDTGNLPTEGEELKELLKKIIEALP